MQWLAIAAAVCALQLRQPELEASMSWKPQVAHELEAASGRWTTCWHHCARPYGDAARSGDVAACLAGCVDGSARAELDGDAWKDADEHAMDEALDEGRHARFQGFWDALCVTGLEEGCRTIPDKVANVWVRVEVRMNETREEGRQWLLREASDFDTEFAAFNGQLAVDYAGHKKTVALRFVGEYMNTTAPWNETEASDEAAALAELETEAEKSFVLLTKNRKKAVAERASEKALHKERGVVDAAAAAATTELAKEGLSGDELATRKGEIHATWTAAHAAADAAHANGVHDAFTKLEGGGAE